MSTQGAFSGGLICEEMIRWAPHANCDVASAKSETSTRRRQSGVAPTAPYTKLSRQPLSPRQNPLNSEIFFRKNIDEITTGRFSPFFLHASPHTSIENRYAHHASLYVAGHCSYWNFYHGDLVGNFIAHVYSWHLQAYVGIFRVSKASTVTAAPCSKSITASSK